METVRVCYTALIKIQIMEDRMIHCIAKSNVQAIVQEARKLKIDQTDIVSMFTLGGQVYLIYYR